MRRILLTAIALAGLAMLAPAAASAHRHRRAHHARHHSRRHHAPAPAARGGAGLLSPTGAGEDHGSTPVPGSATAGSAPAAPTTGPVAGTVLSFKEGVLTIEVPATGPVSGTVGPETELSCRSASGSEAGEDDGEEVREGGGTDASVRSGSAGGGEEDGGEDGESPCTTAALLPGTTVAEAELDLEGGGAVWDHVALIVP
jgi:hypothetical protein